MKQVFQVTLAGPDGNEFESVTKAAERVHAAAPE